MDDEPKLAQSDGSPATTTSRKPRVIIVGGGFAGLAAARALGSLGGEGTALLPPITDLRHVAREVAQAVAQAAADEGLATAAPEAFTKEAIAAMMWAPAYD